MMTTGLYVNSVVDTNQSVLKSALPACDKTSHKQTERNFLAMINLICGDCLEEMAKLPDRSIDLVLTDLPYGITANKWDAVIPFEPMWVQLKRITKKHSPIVLLSTQPFTSALVMSNPKMFRYEWIWNKNNSAGFATAKYRPFQICEHILVFCSARANDYPQMVVRGRPRSKKGYSMSDNYGIVPLKSDVKSNTYYPKNLLEYGNAVNRGKLHPTQKPILLMEYLIRSHSNEGDMVLDFAMGSGTTGVACKNLKRDFIGIELKQKYFEIAVDRIGM